MTQRANMRDCRLTAKPMRSALILISLFMGVLSCDHLKQGEMTPYGRKPFPYILKADSEMGRRPEAILVVSDIDQDKRDEFLRITPASDIENYISYEDERLENVVWRINSHDRLGRPLCVNLDGTGDLEVVVPEKLGDSIYVSVYDSDRKLLNRFVACSGGDHDGDGKWDGQLNLKAAVDLNGDGACELITTVMSSYDLHPRGVRVYDWREGKEIWRFETGTQMAQALPADLNKDGWPEIICATSAPCNGSAANGTDDDHSYVFILNHEGELIWRKETGGGFSGSYLILADMDHDQELDVLQSSYSDPDVGRVLTILDGRTMLPKREKSFPAQTSEPIVKDIDEDGKPDVLLLCHDGRLKMLDANLDTLKEYTDPQQSTNILVEDLNSDGSQEVVISNQKGKNRSTVVLDHKLRRVLAYFEDGGAMVPVRTGPGSPVRIALTSPDYFYVLGLEQNPSYLVSFWPYLIFFAAGAVMMFMAGSLLKRLCFPFKMADKSTLDAFPVGLIALDRKGYVRLCNGKAEQTLGMSREDCVRRHYRQVFDKEGVRLLSDLLKSCLEDNWCGQKRIQIDVDEKTKILESSVYQLGRKGGKRQGILLTFDDITSLAPTWWLTDWVDTTQEGVHEIKNGLQRIALRIANSRDEEGRQGSDSTGRINEFFQMVHEDLIRLRNISSGIERFIQVREPNLQETDMNQLIEEFLEEYMLSLPRDINVEKTLGETLPLARVDRGQIQTVLKNLIDNARDAMPGGGVLSILTSHRQRFSRDGMTVIKNFVVVEIADTGDGIPAEYLAKLFTPGISKKKNGAGMGLVITKRIVENHGGTIHIDSEQGKGTIVIVELPV